MAAPKKTKSAPTTKKKTTAPKAKPAAAKKAPVQKAAAQDGMQELVTVVRGFQVNTLMAAGLAILFLVFQIFDDTRFTWWLNIPVAALSGYLFWRQGNETKGIEQKVCRYGLLAVVAVFLWRDIYISDLLR